MPPWSRAGDGIPRAGRWCDKRHGNERERPCVAVQFDGSGGRTREHGTWPVLNGGDPRRVFLTWDDGGQPCLCFDDRRIVPPASDRRPDAYRGTLPPTAPSPHRDRVRTRGVSFTALGISMHLRYCPQGGSDRRPAFFWLWPASPVRAGCRSAALSGTGGETDSLQKGPAGTAVHPEISR